jgi:hypothetical protein
MKIRIGLLMGVGVMVVMATAVAIAAGGTRFAVPWWTVDGGGGHSAGTRFGMTGTAGQPDAGVVMSSSRYTFSGGFWRGVVAAGPGGGVIYLPAVLKPTPCFPVGQEQEDNDSGTQANGLLCSDGVMTGAFDDQNDWFSFRTASAGLIDIQLTGYTGTDAQILLYYQGTSSSDRVAQGVSPDYHINYTGPAGLYYVRVYVPTANNQTYSLTVNYP